MLETRRTSELPLTPLNVGDIPADWDVKRIGDVAHKVTNGFVGKSLDHQTNSSGILYLQGFNIRPARIDLSNKTHVTRQFHDSQEKSALKAGDVLVVQSGHIGTCARIPDEFVEANCHALIIIDPFRKKLDPDFLVYYLNSEVGQRRLRGLHVGSSMLHINTSELAEYRIPLPVITEQRKIAEIMCTWDDALGKLETLRTVKQRRLDGLRSLLLLGSVRLEGSRRRWLSRQLSEVTYEISDRNTNLALGRELVMGVTNSRGIVPMREQTIAEDISRYKRLPPRAFAYNPMRINVGSIAINESAEVVLVSPDYVVFACKDHDLQHDYLNHLRETRWWADHINSGGSGGVRRRTYYDDLGALQLPLPKIDEQRNIVRILNAARNELTATDKMINALNRQKRGLMRNLLTGKWRVKSAVKEAAA
jgi:type I restriction enzyme S subunit